MKVNGVADLSPLEDDEVWSFISDVEKVAKCFPGLRSIEKVGDNAYRVMGQIAVGLIKGDYVADVVFTKVDHASKELAFNAKGKGLNSQVELNANLKVLGSRLHYEADVKISGVLASLASRVLSPVVNRIIEGLAGCVKDSISE